MRLLYQKSEVLYSHQEENGFACEAKYSILPYPNPKHLLMGKTEYAMINIGYKVIGLIGKLEDKVMAVSNIKAVFQSNIKDVWNIVTSLEKYQWRSDLSKIEIINEKQFVEYTKNGYATTFTITASEPLKRWEFDMENSNMKGHWTGIFTEKDGHTEIDFTENVTAKKLIMKPFVKAFLKKQQELFVSDLRKALQ